MTASSTAETDSRLESWASDDFGRWHLAVVGLENLSSLADSDIVHGFDVVVVVVWLVRRGRSEIAWCSDSPVTQSLKTTQVRSRYLMAAVRLKWLQVCGFDSVAVAIGKFE